jgi:hypothetical protein
MRSWLLILVISASIVAVSITGISAAEPEVLPAFPIGTSGMALTPPAGWIASRDQDGASLVLRSPAPAAPKEPQPLTSPGDHQEAERARAAVSVVVQELRNDESPEAFAQRCRVDLERLGTAVVITGQDPVTLAGRLWTRMGYHFRLGRFTWQQELYTTSISGTGYCLTCSCIDADYAHWQAAFSAILASLEHSRPALEGASGGGK